MRDFSAKSGQPVFDQIDSNLNTSSTLFGHFPKVFCRRSSDATSVILEANFRFQICALYPGGQGKVVTKYTEAPYISPEKNVEGQKIKLPSLPFAGCPA